MTGVNLSGLLYIYRARLEARAVLVQEAFAILGIAVGVALLFASQVASTSLDQSAAQLNNQFVGSTQVQLDARGPEGVSEQLLRALRRTPAVEVALPVFQQQVNLIGARHRERSVELVGVEPRAVRASGPLLRRFSAKQLEAQEAIALPAPLASELGIEGAQLVHLQVGGNFVETLVGATLGAKALGGLLHSPIVLATLHYAQSIAGAKGRLSRIFVRYDPAHGHRARAELARIAGSWHVNLLPGRFDARLFSVAVAPASNSETLFSGISALVGFMLALNAMLITVPSRRKLIEDLRPHGASRWDTIKILLVDATIIGTLACLIGLALGDLLSLAVFQSTPAYLAVAFPIGNNRVVTGQSFAIAVTAGMAAALIGVFWPLRGVLTSSAATRPDPARSRRWTAVRLLIGLPCLAASGILLAIDPHAAIAGDGALIIALLSLLPLLFDLSLRLFERLSDALDGVGSALAVRQLQTPHTRVRSLAIAATAAIAVFGVVEFQGAQANLEKGLNRSSRSIDSAADIWIMPRGKTSIQPTTPFRALDASKFAGLPGVRAVGIFRGSFLDWGDRRLWVLAPANNSPFPVPVSQIIEGSPSLAALRIRAGGWAVLSQALAQERGLRVGETFTLPAPRPLRLRLAALITNLGWPPGAVIISSATYARAWTDGRPTAYAIQTSKDASTTAVRDRVQSALGSTPGLAVETAQERNRRRYVVVSEGLSRLTQIRILVLIAAILAVIGAMGSMIWQRRSHIAFIKCHGYGESVLWRWLLAESSVLLATGCLMGSIFGLYGQMLLSHVLNSVTGFPIVIDIEALAAVSSFALVTGFALAAVVLPGYLVVRVPANAASPAT